MAIVVMIKCRDRLPEKLSRFNLRSKENVGGGITVRGLELQFVARH